MQMNLVSLLWEVTNKLWLDAHPDMNKDSLDLNHLISSFSHPLQDSWRKHTALQWRLQLSNANIHEFSTTQLPSSSITGIMSLVLLFNGLFSRTTRVSRHQKSRTILVKPIWIYWSKRQWVAVASAGRYANLHLTPDRYHASTPPLSPTNSVKALKAKMGLVTPEQILNTGRCNNNNFKVFSFNISWYSVVIVYWYQ